jgi:phosphopantetheinyl transferase
MSLYQISVENVSEENVIQFMENATLSTDERDRVARYIRPIHRFHQCVSFSLQKYAMSKYMSDHHIPLTRGSPTIIRPPKEKPYCDDYPEVHFNASHSGGHVVVYVDSRPCGVDIECMDGANPSRVSDVLYDVLGKKHGVPRTAFPPIKGIKLWTRIEAWLKLIGCGLKGLYDISVSYDLNTKDITLHHQNQPMPCSEDISLCLPDGVYGSLMREGGAIHSYEVNHVTLEDIV